MASVDPLYAQWLQSETLWATRQSAAGVARWGDGAIKSERQTGIATRADAEAEADRQLAFFARGPFAVDEHSLLGTDWGAFIGRIVTLDGDRLGYDAGVDVFVLEVEVDRAAGMSKVAVLAPLGALA